MQQEYMQSEEETRAIIQAATQDGGASGQAQQGMGQPDSNSYFGLSSIGSLPLTGSVAAEMFGDSMSM